VNNFVRMGNPALVLKLEDTRLRDMFSSRDELWDRNGGGRGPA